MPQPDSHGAAPAAAPADPVRPPEPAPAPEAPKPVASRPPPPDGGAKPPVVRAEPKTLEEHLARGYAARFALEGADSEKLPDCHTRLAKSGLPRGKLEAEAARLRAVSVRCTVSLCNAELIEAALAEMTA